MTVGAEGSQLIAVFVICSHIDRRVFGQILQDTHTGLIQRTVLLQGNLLDGSVIGVQGPGSVVCRIKFIGGIALLYDIIAHRIRRGCPDIVG